MRDHWSIPLKSLPTLDHTNNKCEDTTGGFCQAITKQILIKNQLKCYFWWILIRLGMAGILNNDLVPPRVSL